MGPNIIFDKSFLQSLNPDEAAWLDQFYTSVITPLFFVETLADLEKEHSKGRTPEDVVGNLAYKTPDMDAVANSHHRIILTGELGGAGKVDMDTGRPMRIGGRDVAVDGEHGVVIDLSPEEEALSRWQQRDYTSVERKYAGEWRRELARVNTADQRARFQGWFGSKRPVDLAIVKSYADDYINGENPRNVLSYGLSLLGVPASASTEILKRWEDTGQPPLRTFAPYFCHVYSIDLFFLLSRSADLISGRATNMIDIAYLYYLPFCMVFTSNDKLHRNTVPLFLREDQSFIWGQELKDDLCALDMHYDKLPESVKAKGTHYFASRPPADPAFLTTRLWDDYMKRGWRSTGTRAKSSGNSAFESQIIAKMKQATDAAEEAPIRPDSGSGKVDFMITKHSVLRKKGKWSRYPEVSDNPTDEYDS